MCGSGKSMRPEAALCSIARNRDNPINVVKDLMLRDGPTNFWRDSLCPYEAHFGAFTSS